jgi:hypothetical protein
VLDIPYIFSYPLLYAVFNWYWYEGSANSLFTISGFNVPLEAGQINL